MFPWCESDVVVKRQGAGDYVDGVFVKVEADVVFSIKATVQPVSAGDIMHMTPDGYLNSVTYVLYTKTQLITAKGSLQNADIVIIDNESFLVVRVDKWKFYNTCIDHYRILVAKENFDDPI